MRKFIKILVAMVAVSMTAIGSIQSAKAVWPPAVWPPERRLLVDEATYNAMIDANEPVATYCFYNPDTLSHIDSLTLHGYDDVNPNKTVAICLKTQEAQRRFREHFEDRFRDLHIDSRENLFIISVGDLWELNEKMLLFTKRLPSHPDRGIYRDWCVRNVFSCSCLRAGVQGDGNVEIDPRCRAKIRVLTRAFGQARAFRQGFAPGRTIRIWNNLKDIEKGWLESGYWSDVDEVFDTLLRRWTNIQPRQNASSNHAASAAAAAESSDASRPNKRSRPAASAAAAAERSDTSRPNKRSRPAASAAAAESSDMPGSGEEYKPVSSLTDPPIWFPENSTDGDRDFGQGDAENETSELFPHSPRICYYSSKFLPNSDEPDLGKEDEFVLPPLDDGSDPCMYGDEFVLPPLDDGSDPCMHGDEPVSPEKRDPYSWLKPPQESASIKALSDSRNKM